MLVDKSDRTLTLFRGGEAFATYRDLAFGDALLGHKRFEGDERTTAAHYTIDTRNPNSAYHLSLRISYPDARDRAYAAARGLSPYGSEQYRTANYAPGPRVSKRQAVTLALLRNHPRCMRRVSRVTGGRGVRCWNSGDSVCRNGWCWSSTRCCCSQAFSS